MALTTATVRAEPPCPPSPQPPSAEEAQAAAAAARDRGFLWRISKDGHSSWLYGTLHLARFEWLFPGPNLASALRAADAVALELDLLDAEVQRRLGTPPDGVATLVLPEPMKQRLARQVELACLPAQSLSALPPALQVAALTALAARWDGLDPSYAIDPMLSQLARHARKPVHSLETPELQARALIGDSSAEHLRFVDESLRELELGRARPAMLRMAEVWARGDLAELENYEQWCDCAGSEHDRALLHRLLDERNHGMAERIARLHEAGASVLVGVGSLHMIGAQGLPALMRQRGYAVQRVSFER